MSGITDFSFNALTGHPVLVALCLVIFLVFAYLLYRRTNPPLSGPVRIILSLLRIIAIIALFLALFEPVVSYRRDYDRAPRLTIIRDRSLSMGITETNRPRSERVDSLLGANRFQSFAAPFDIRHADFADRLAADNITLDPDATALGEALRELAAGETAEPSEAWLLLTDGITNRGISPLEVAARLKTPVYALGVGELRDEKDIAITGLDYNDVVFAGKPTEITVHLAWSGTSGERADVTIKSGAKTLQRGNLTLPSGDLKEEVKLKFVPEKPGQQTFRVTVPALDGELSDKNNSRSFSVSVLKSKLKVLLVADYLDWDYAFLNRFLERSESVDLTPVVFKRGGGYLTGRLPSRQEELNAFDLVIMYDINPTLVKPLEPFFESYLNDRGGGVLVILGKNYVSRPFPRWIDNYLPFISQRSGRDLLYFKFNGQPVENFLFHPAVRISDSRVSIRQAWRDMPPFEALVPLDSICPGTDILVTTASVSEGLPSGGLPVIGLRKFGPGKVLALGATPLWPWAFFGYGFGADNTEYRLFVDGVVNWLALREESDPIRIVPDREIYTRGETVGFTAFVYDLGFRPISGATGYIALTGADSPDSMIVQLVGTSDGKYRAEFELLAPGRYNFMGVVEKDGKRLKEKSGQIAVESFSIEEYRRRPDFTVLASLAQMTGGEFAPLDNADSLFTMIDSSRIGVSVQSEIVLWNKFWLLALFIAALALEWFLRKRYQLI